MICSNRIIRQITYFTSNKNKAPDYSEAFFVTIL